MSILSTLTRLFSRAPRYHTSAYGPLGAALVTRLQREGVHVGRTAGYPRVEVHSFIEGERLDKDGRLRSVTCTVESMSNVSKAAAGDLNDANLKLLTETDLEVSGWTCLGVVPGTLQDIDEVSDPQKVLYRLLQEVTIYMEKTPGEETPAGQGNNESSTN